VTLCNWRGRLVLRVLYRHDSRSEVGKGVFLKKNDRIYENDLRR